MWQEVDRRFVNDVRAFIRENPGRKLKLSDLSPREFVRCYLEWNGIIGYDGDILDLVEQLGWKNGPKPRH